MNWKYLPILKWKQGERIAVRNVSAATWSGMVVMFELLPSGLSVADLRTGLSGYLDPVAKETKRGIPEGKPVAIDTRYVCGSYGNQVRLLAVACEYLRKRTGSEIVPVVGENMLTALAADLGRLNAFDNIILRIRTSGATPDQIMPFVEVLTGAGIDAKKIHLVLDQFSIVGEDHLLRAKQIAPYVDAAMLIKVASVTLAGGAFPETLIGIKQGIADIPRVDWKVFEVLAKKHKALRYSDYTVSNPILPPDSDPTKLNPSVAIRYCYDNVWRLFKAGGFKGGTPNQYNSLSKLLISDAVYSGVGFSYGDDQYNDAASGKNGGGTPSSWRKEATSHHMAFVSSKI